MAQNTWINLGADKSTTSKPDGDGNHTAAGGTSASGDFTISFDSTVVTSLNMFDSLVRRARLRAMSGGLK
jgi:hypothetical protein